MRKILIVIALIVQSVGRAQAPTPGPGPSEAPATAQAQLVLDTEWFDFGKVARDTTVRHEFRVTNRGGTPLHILRVVPACGCTTAPVDKAVLAPGETTRVKVGFNTAGFLGPVQKTIRIESDDPKRPAVTLTFAAEVTAAVVAARTEVWFQDLTRKDRRHDSVRLQSFTGEPLSVDRVELSEAPWLGVATRPDGNDQWVDLDLLARRLPPGKLEGLDTLDLHVSNPGPSLIHLQVHWQLLAPVRLSPERLAMAGTAGQALTGSVVLEGRGDLRFRVLSARSSNPLLAVSAGTARASSRQTVHLRFSAGARPGTYEEKALLTLDSPGHPVLELPVEVYVAQAHR